MTEQTSELLNRLVAGRKRDGRCTYDPQAKRELILQCLKPGVSVSRIALKYGINANLLRSWIAKASPLGSPSVPGRVQLSPLEQALAFVPVKIGPSVPTASALTTPITLRLQVHLPNAVTVDLGQSQLEALGAIMQMLGTLKCSS